MIVVIADDFTGAAEIAGLGLEYGLSVTMELDVVKDINTDLLIIATDTRSMSSLEAYNKTKEINKSLLDVEYDWLFKKTDSVFRGHILSELNALLHVNLKKKVLLVTSNPALGRKIVNGKYYINDKPLNLTEFANDPEYPIKSADVLELLKNDLNAEINIISADDKLSNDGIYFGEASSVGDLTKLAANVNDEVLPAGASGFFAALLEANGKKKKPVEKNISPNCGKRVLIVKGSAFKEKGNSDREFAKSNVSEVFMPNNIFDTNSITEKDLDIWCNEILNKYQKFDRVRIGINQPVVNDREISKRLRDTLGLLVQKIMKKICIEELIIDGGATAYSIISRLNYKKFYPKMQIAPGIIRMTVEENPSLCITLKPGSYKLPDSFFFN
jgi:uncharacterized protein YgbK (DUF1537 family)